MDTHAPSPKSKGRDELNIVVKKLDGKVVIVRHTELVGCCSNSCKYRTLDGHALDAIAYKSFAYVYEVGVLLGGAERDSSHSSRNYRSSDSGSNKCGYRAEEDDHGQEEQMASQNSYDPSTLRSSSPGPSTPAFYPASQPIMIPTKTLSAGHVQPFASTLGVYPASSGMSFEAGLSLSKSLGYIQPSSVSSSASVAPPPPVPSKKTSKSMKCAANGCTDRAAKIIGDCRYCDLSYCSTHRLPESHHCDNISTCRQESYDRNSTKLLGEKCVADKL